MTGSELRAHRQAAGLSQQALAQRAGVSRDTVQYWEAKAQVDLRGYAPRRFFDVMVPHPGSGEADFGRFSRA